MEIRQLKYFLAVAEQKSFVNAANQLFVSRQAISKAIGQLETELNVELFMRNTNGAFLTPAGIMFYDRIRSSVTDFEQIRSDMQENGARYRQMVRMAFSVGTISLFEDALEKFRAYNRNMVLECQECQESRCVDLLMNRSADIVICTTEPDDPLLAGERLGSWPYGVLLPESDPVSRQEEISDGQLSGIKLACLQDGEGQLPEICAGRNLKPAYTGLDYHRLFGLVRAGKCGLLLPRRLDPAEAGMRWVPLEQAPMWSLYQVHLQAQGNSILYKTMLEEIQAATSGGLEEAGASF